MPECIRCLIMVKSEGKEHDERQSTLISTWRVVSLMECALSVPNATQVTSGLEPPTLESNLKWWPCQTKDSSPEGSPVGRGFHRCSSAFISLLISSLPFWHICRQQVKHNIELLSLNIRWQRQTLQINHQSSLNVPEVPQAQKQMWKSRLSLGALQKAEPD